MASSSVLPVNVSIADSGVTGNTIVTMDPTKSIAVSFFSQQRNVANGTDLKFRLYAVAHNLKPIVVFYKSHRNCTTNHE